MTLVSFGLFSSVELRIADIHDGDATSVAAVSGPAASTDLPDSDRGPGAPAQGHDVHIDHCAHGHSVPVSGACSSTGGVPDGAAVLSRIDLFRGGRTLAPPVPPPVA